MNQSTDTPEQAADDLIFFDLLSKARDIFHQRVIASHPEHGSLMCSIHAAYEPPDMSGHNCLGCNFDDLTGQLDEFLTIASQMQSEHHIFSIYVLLVNGIWERMTDVFEIVGVPNEYKEDNFKPFYRARWWAHFFKHPKSFSWLIHHPVYLIKDSKAHITCQADDNMLLVDDNFVRNHYRSESCPSPDSKFEEYRENTVVILPNIEKLTNNLCYSLEHFVELVTKNPVYISMLSDKATILHHYDEDCAEAPTVKM